MESITNDIDGLKLALWIAGTVMGIMVSVIGYFLRRQIDASVKLTDAVNNLTLVVNTLQVQSNTTGPRNEARLVELGRLVEEHGKRLVILETEHKMNHCIKNHEIQGRGSIADA